MTKSMNHVKNFKINVWTKRKKKKMKKVIHNIYTFTRRLNNSG